MSDPSTIATNGGFLTAIIALVIAGAEYIKTRNAKELEKKLKETAPSPPPPPEPEKQIIFERSRSIPSVDLIARVETYVRAEGDLRIQLAQKEWEIKELLEQRDAYLTELQKTKLQLEGLRQELHTLHRQIQGGVQSKDERAPAKHPSRNLDRVLREPHRHPDRPFRVDREEPRQGTRKKYTDSDD